MVPYPSARLNDRKEKQTNGQYTQTAGRHNSCSYRATVCQRTGENDPALAAAWPLEQAQNAPYLHRMQERKALYRSAELCAGRRDHFLHYWSLFLAHAHSVWCLKALHMVE